MSRKLLLAASVLFGILTFAGAGYVLLTKGQVNAGYAVVPMVFALALFSAYRSQDR